METTVATSPALPPFTQKILGYVLAFALAYIAAKWGVVPAAPSPAVIIVPTTGPVSASQVGVP